MDHNILQELAEQLEQSNKCIKASMEYINRIEADNRVMRQLLIDMAKETTKDTEVKK